MDSVETAVLAGGIALIVFVLWFFFGARARTAADVGEGGVQRVKITVKGGYSPDTIVVTQGVPVRLDFYRDETSSCSDQVILGDFGIARDLPPFETTTVEFTPDTAGTFSFTCGMRMLHGKLVVTAAQK